MESEVRNVCGAQSQRKKERRPCVLTMQKIHFAI